MTDTTDSSTAGAATSRDVRPRVRADDRWGLVALVVVLYAGAIFLPFLGTGRTLTSHEVMVTQPALRILETGQWVVPPYNDELWLDKPPLVNWITAGFFAALGGFSEMVARLPSALSAIGMCLLVAAITRRFVSTTAGLFAGLVQATCVYAYTQGRLGEIDMPFALLIAAALAALVWRWGDGHTDLPLGLAAVFHTLAGLATLAKGPLAVALCGATIMGFCAIRRSWRPLRAVLLTPAIACFLLIVVPWHVAAVMQVGQIAIDEWNYNYFQRFAGRTHLGVTSVLYYFYTIPWWALPWSLVLIVYAPRLIRSARQRDAAFEHFLWAWFLAGLVLLTLSSFKHKHYCIPILPPLSMFCGKLMAEDAARFGARMSWRIYVPIFAALLVAFGVVSGFVMPKRDPRRATVEFLRGATAALPADATLYVVGLGQSAAYPYIEHPCRYIGSVQEIQAAVGDPARQPAFFLTMRGYLKVAEEQKLSFEEVAGEQPSKKVSWEEALVVVRPRGA